MAYDGLKPNLRARRAYLITGTLVVAATAVSQISWRDTASEAKSVPAARASTDIDPPWVTTPEGVHVRVVVEARLLDPNGNPWTSPVQVHLLGEDGSAGEEVATPLPSGDVEACIYLPEEEVFNSKCKASFWANPAIIAQRGGSGLFLSPSEGEGGFGEGAPKGTLAVGTKLNLGDITITAPPLVGTVNLSPAAPVPVKVHVAVGSPVQYGIASGPWYDWSEDFPAGLTGFSVYSWGIDSWYTFELWNPQQSAVYAGDVRRDESVTVTFADDVEFDVSVNMTTYPTATTVLFVEPALHQPNSGATGSAVEFSILLDESSNGPLDANGLLSNMFMSADNFYVQLWGWDVSDPSNPQESLLDWEYVPVNTGIVTLSFP